MKAAIITGASAGIGSATASAFLHNGFAVFSLARRDCPVEGVTSLRCDLANDESIRRALDQLLQNIPQPCEIALVHNASQMRKDSTANCDSLWWKYWRPMSPPSTASINACCR